MADSPAERYIRAFGITSTSSAFGVATGVPAGGPIAGCLSWHRVFFVSIPVGITAILTAAWIIPHDSPGDPSGRKGKGKELFDIPGALFSLFGLVALLSAMNSGERLGWTSPVVLPPGAAASDVSQCLHPPGEKVLYASPLNPGPVPNTSAISRNGQGSAFNVETTKKVIVVRVSLHAPLPAGPLTRKAQAFSFCFGPA